LSRPARGGTRPEPSAGRRVLRNFGILASGRVAAALLNLAALFLMARALPLAEFGTLVLLQTYVLTVRGLFNLKPFLAVVRYGVGPAEDEDRESLATLLRLSRRIDGASAALAAAAAAAAAPVAGGVLGWDGRAVGCAVAFSAVLLVSGTGTATGTLRLFDRFGVLAWQRCIGPALRAAGALGAWLAGAGFVVFVALWVASLACEYLYLLAAGRREAAARGIPRRPAGTAPGAGYPGLSRFLAQAWLQTVLDMVPNRLATLLVGVSLGAEEAGLFRVARELAGVLLTPVKLVRQVIFPDLARLWLSSAAGFRRLLRQVTLVAGAAGVAFAALAAIAGEALLGLVFGAPFAAAAGALTWLVVAAAFELGGAALRPAGYAMGLAGRVLAVHLASVLLFAAAFQPLLARFGVAGIGMATSVLMAAMLAGLHFAIAQGLRLRGA